MSPGKMSSHNVAFPMQALFYGELMASEGKSFQLYIQNAFEIPN